MTTTLGEVCKLQKGKKPRVKPTKGPGDQPYLVAKFLRGSAEADFASVDDRNAILVSRGDIIIICDGSNSGETFIGFEGVLASTMAKVSHSDDVDTRYLLAFLSSRFASLNESKIGAAIPHLDLDGLRASRFPVPPVAEQQRIVGILDAAFDAVATARANTEQNLRNVSELFQTQLQSVLTEGAGRWARGPLSSLCSLFVDSAHRTPRYQKEGIPALRPRDVVNGTLDLSAAARVSESEYEVQSRRHKPVGGDIVYSRELSYGWAAVLPTSPRVCLSQGMCLFRPSTDVDSSFLLSVLNGPIGREQAFRAAVGTAHPHVNLGEIKSFSIPLPPLGEQRELARRFDALAAQTERLSSIYQEKLAALDALKGSLLHKAFSGSL